MGKYTFDFTFLTRIHLDSKEYLLSCFRSIRVFARTDAAFSRETEAGTQHITANLYASLDDLVSLLMKSGKEKFENTTRYLGDSELVFSKGAYPYSYMTDRSKFQESQLPPIKDFYNTLKDEPLSTEDYERAQNTWKFFNIQNLQQYHDHYHLSDVLLLSDVL